MKKGMTLFEEQGAVATPNLGPFEGRNDVKMIRPPVLAAVNPVVPRRGVVVEFPEDMTMDQIRELFPKDRFRLVAKPGGVVCIQLITHEGGLFRLVNAGTVAVTRKLQVLPSR